MPNLELKGGVVDGTFYDEKMIQVIATIPQEKYCSENYLEVSSPLLPTLLVLLSRSLKKTEKGLQLSKISYQ